MSKTRVLLADDSVVVRKLLSEILSQDPDIQVVGTAPDGEILLKKIPDVSPDVVVLDVEMPNLDGLETLKRIKLDYPDLPVLMFSNLTRRGAEATMDALLAGAKDYVTKPQTGSLAESIQQIRECLIPRLKALKPRGDLTAPWIPKGSFSKGPGAVPHHPVEVVVIGTSTGGPNALAEILGELGSKLQVPIVIVQHMPPVFTAALANRLSLRSTQRVHEAKQGELLRPGEVLIAPGDFHLGLEAVGSGIAVRVFQASPIHFCRPSVDVLFQDAAALYGAGVLAVVLTGMGRDGLQGCERIRAAQGRILVQDEATSVVWGMPGAVAQAGLADEVLPIGEMAAEITRRVGVPAERRAL